MAASEQQYLQGVSQISKAMTRTDMDEVLQQFVQGAQMAADMGDWLSCTARTVSAVELYLATDQSPKR